MMTRFFVALLSLSVALGCAPEVGWGVQVERSMQAEVSGQQLDYWIYEPASEEGERGLLLFLHGSGERGSDLELVKTHGPPALIGSREELRELVVVSPQCPEDGWWQADTLAALVAEVLAAHPSIDRDRLYVTGLSMGGYGTWSLITQHPDLFAAAAPICGGGDPARLDLGLEPTGAPFELESLVEVRDLPIWVFHGEDDTVVPLEESRILVEALRDQGSEVRFTTYAGIGHNSWKATYADPELYAWLFQQRR